MDLIQLPIKRYPHLLEENLELVDLFKKIESWGGTICGGSARYSLDPVDSPAPSKDIDLFPSSIRAFIDLTQILSYEWKLKPEETEYSGFLVRTFKVRKKKYIHKVQLILNAGSPPEIISKFDISVCQAYLDLRNCCAAMKRDSFDDLWKREFSFNIERAHDASNTIYRVGRYLEKGFRLKKESVLKVIRYLSSKDENFKNEFITTILPRYMEDDYIKLLARYNGL